MGELRTIAVFAEPGEVKKALNPVSVDHLSFVLFMLRKNKMPALN